MKLIDFAARKIGPGDIEAAGFDGVVVYVSESRPGTNFEAKPVTREYAEALRAEGLHIVSNFQFGKPAELHRRISPAGSTVGSKTPGQRCACMKPPAVQTPRRSSSASMTTST